MKDDSMRLALLLRGAGLVDDASWKKYLQYHGGSTPLGEVLKQEVSLETFKNLFNIDIKLPFSGESGDATEEDLHVALSQPLKFSPEEIRQLLRNHRPDLKSLLHLLEETELVDKGAAKNFLAEFSGSDEKAVDALSEKGILTEKELSAFASLGTSSSARTNRSAFALEILAINKLISEQELTQAKKRPDAREALAKLVEKHPRIANANLLKLVDQGLYLPIADLSGEQIPRPLLEAFPTELLRKELFVPFRRDDGWLYIAVADPLNLSLSDALSLLTGQRVVPFYASQDELIRKLNALFPTEGEAAGEAVTTGVAAEQLGMLVDNLSTVQLVSSVIESAITLRATDIHLEPQEKFLKVRYRIDGSLHAVMKIPNEMTLPVTSRIKVLANMNVTERRRPQDGHFSLQVSDSAFDFRVSTLPTHLGEKTVIRILDSGTLLRGTGELGLNESQQAHLEKLISRPYGIILVTGPTGSGKTTTLYTCLNQLHEDTANIVTIEDPVEYKLAGINQVQVETNIGLTFANGLRSILRQDPDIIMVGEIRDVDTATIAIRAALTGHRVFSTLHTNTSPGAVTALVHMGIQPYLIASSIIGVISQRLIKRICHQCKEPSQPNEALLRDLGLQEGGDEKFFHGKGCKSCLNTGYSGRIGLYEMLVIDDEIRRLINARASEEDLYKAAIADGMMTLHRNGLEKIELGITSPEEVAKVVFLE
ncbi:MAG: GspE/PulE family protein [bacterium]